MVTVELALRRPAFGREHSDTLASIEDLARALVAAGKVPEAETLWRQLVSIREMKIPDDWLTFYSRAMLGDTLIREKRFSRLRDFLDLFGDLFQR